MNKAREFRFVLTARAIQLRKRAAKQLAECGKIDDSDAYFLSLPEELVSQNEFLSGRNSDFYHRQEASGE